MESTDIVDQGVTVSEGLLLNREREGVKYITGYSSCHSQGLIIDHVAIGPLQLSDHFPNLNFLCLTWPSASFAL